MSIHVLSCKTAPGVVFKGRNDPSIPEEKVHWFVLFQFNKQLILLFYNFYKKGFHLPKKAKNDMAEEYYSSSRIQKETEIVRHISINK